MFEDYLEMFIAILLAIAFFLMMFKVTEWIL